MYSYRNRSELLVYLFVLTSQLSFAGDSFVHSIKGDKDHWTAIDWNSAERALFGGEPEYHGDEKHLLLVRYSYFVSQYDTDRLCPLWVAHIDEDDGRRKDAARKGPEWDRGLLSFSPDQNVVVYSKSFQSPYTTSKSFENANPKELSVGDKGYEKITRGHMASNQEMKSH